jgi:hypothetical protein
MNSDEQDEFMTVHDCCPMVLTLISEEKDELSDYCTLGLTLISEK